MNITTAKPSSHHVIRRLIPALAVWAVGKVLAAPKVKKNLDQFDQRAHQKKRDAVRAVRRAGRNAAGNAGLVAAGAAALAVGIGLMTKATRK